MLRAEVIRHAGRLEELSGQWRRLAEEIGGVSPFQLPDWQLLWWHRFGSGELHGFGFWEDQRLVGVIPAFLHNWENRRQLTLLGSGITDYLEPCILHPSVIDGLSGQLQSDETWDICDWQDLSGETPLQRLTGLNVALHADTPGSAIHLDVSFESYWLGRSADLRRNIKRYKRKAEAEGPITFRVQANNPALLQSLIELHGARWQRQGQTGMVEQNQSADFLRDVATLESSRLFSLEWKGEVVAATIGLVREQTIYSYLSAFDPRYEILGFGRLLLYQSLGWAFENRYSHWDFLRGDEPYKASWGAAAIPKCRLLITRS